VLDVVADAVEQVAGEVAPVVAVAEHAVEGDDHSCVEGDDQVSLSEPSFLLRPQNTVSWPVFFAVAVPASKERTKQAATDTRAKRRRDAIIMNVD
jgi:hypothetical protein